MCIRDRETCLHIKQASTLVTALEGCGKHLGVHIKNWEEQAEAGPPPSTTLSLYFFVIMFRMLRSCSLHRCPITFAHMPITSPLFSLNISQHVDSQKGVALFLTFPSISNSTKHAHTQNKGRQLTTRSEITQIMVFLLFPVAFSWHAGKNKDSVHLWCLINGLTNCFNPSQNKVHIYYCLLYTSPSPRDRG